MVQQLQMDNFRKTYEKFADAETVDVGLIIAGKCDATHIDNLITIAENRKDCVVFASPQRADVVNVVTNSNTQTSNVIDFFDNMVFVHHLMLCLTVVTKMYDRFNDVYRLCL